MTTISKTNSKSDILFILNNSGKVELRIPMMNLRIQIPP